jgi:hypothetical protein
MIFLKLFFIFILFIHIILFTVKHILFVSMLINILFILFISNNLLFLLILFCFILLIIGFVTRFILFIVAEVFNLFISIIDFITTVLFIIKVVILLLLYYHASIWYFFQGFILYSCVIYVNGLFGVVKLIFSFTVGLFLSRIISLFVCNLTIEISCESGIFVKIGFKQLNFVGLCLPMFLTFGNFSWVKLTISLYLLTGTHNVELLY